MFDEEGCLNAPAGMLEDYKKYSMKAISHQSGSIDRSLMLGKIMRFFTIPQLCHRHPHHPKREWIIWKTM